MTGTMRICHLIDRNRATGFFRSIARLHDRERYPVAVGSLEPEGSLQVSMRELGVTTFALGCRSRAGYPRAVLALARRLRAEGGDVLHAHCFDPTLVGWAAARLARKRFVFTRHHSDHHLRMGKTWHTRLDAWSAWHADHVIAVSEATRRIQVQVEGAPEASITVVYDGLEPLFAPDVDRVAILREELGLAARPAVLVVARLHEEKGHRVLLRAWPAIVAAVGPAVLLMAGEGPARAELEAECERIGIEGTVRWLGWRQDIPELLALSSVVVLPSLAESFGYAVLEGMSLGRPVVATAVGGVPEIIEHERTGLLVAPADSGALSVAVARVLTDRDLAARLGAAGRKRAAQFGFESMIKGYEAVYANLIENSEGWRGRGD